MRKNRTTVAVDDPFDGFSCPNSFRCCDQAQAVKLSRFGESCRVQCLSDCGADCEHAVCFSDAHLCTCPVRTYLLDRLMARRAECLEHAHS